MPADRFLHKRAGLGERTGQLSHLEWRVWTVYLLASDDFGVMWNHQSALHTACHALTQEHDRKLRAALEKLVNLKLLARFTHQGRSYLYQRDWQNFQKVKFPSETELPRIPSLELEGCSPEQQRLVAAWPGGRAIPTKEEWQPLTKNLESDSLTASEVLSENLPITSPSRARVPAGTNGYGSGYGNGSGVSSEESARETSDFERFWAAYPRRVGKDAARKAFDRRRSDVTLEAVLAALEAQKGAPQWQREGGRYVPHPATWLNQGRWQDEVDTGGSALTNDEWAVAAEIRRKSYGRCPHEQPCANYDECVTTIGLARRAGAA